jgi:hypothetical protein
VGTDSTLSRSLTVSTGAVLSVLVPSTYTRPRRRRSEKGGLIQGRTLGRCLVSEGRDWGIGRQSRPCRDVADHTGVFIAGGSMA